MGRARWLRATEKTHPKPDETHARKLAEPSTDTIGASQPGAPGVLPKIGEEEATETAKQLHSQSHRGIASIHRSISSMKALDAEQTRSTRELLSVTARQAALLRETVARYS